MANEQTGTSVRRTNRAGKQLVCDYCDRAFAKADHLDRHVRAHSKEKPFKCDVCGRCYSRHDTLLRHRRDHDTNKELTPSREAQSTTPDTIPTPSTGTPQQSSFILPSVGDYMPISTTTSRHSSIPNSTSPVQHNIIDPDLVSPMQNSYHYLSSGLNPQSHAFFHPSLQFFEVQFPSWLPNEHFNLGFSELQPPAFHVTAPQGSLDISIHIDPTLNPVADNPYQAWSPNIPQERQHHSRATATSSSVLGSDEIQRGTPYGDQTSQQTDHQPFFTDFRHP